MKPADLKEALDEKTRKRIFSFFDKENPRRDMLYAAAARVFDDTTVSAFASLVTSKGFASFINAKQSSSIARFEHTLILLFTRASIGIDPHRVGECAQRMTEEPFLTVERSFFFVPVDREGFELFERIFLDVSQQNLDLGNILAEFCAGETFGLLRCSWNYNKVLFEDIFSRLAGLLLAKRRDEPLLHCAETLHTGCNRLYGFSGNNIEIGSPTRISPPVSFAV